MDKFINNSMTLNSSMTKAVLEPKSALPVRELLITAGINVSGWGFGKDGEPIANPNANSYKNSFWSFLDQNSVVLCVWFNDISSDAEGIYFADNMQKLANDEGNKRNQREITAGEKTRHALRENKARQFHSMTYEAYRNRRPVRVIILDKDIGKDGGAEHAEARALDSVSWYVDSFDGFTGEFRLRRGPMPERAYLTEDELAALDLAHAVEDINTNETLSETEKEALIKQRVGQGLFRARLMERWNKRCALTEIQTTSLLIASHIVPWSKCETVAQRLEPSNGLLLAAHIDRLFDTGYISFNDDFYLVIHPKLPLFDVNRFGLNPQMRLKRKAADILISLRWHRANVFGKPFNGNILNSAGLGN